MKHKELKAQHWTLWNATYTIHCFRLLHIAQRLLAGAAATDCMLPLFLHADLIVATLHIYCRKKKIMDAGSSACDLQGQGGTHFCSSVGRKVLSTCRVNTHIFTAYVAKAWQSKGNDIMKSWLHGVWGASEWLPLPGMSLWICNRHALRIMRIVIVLCSSGVSAVASKNGNCKFYQCNQEFELCAVPWSGWSKETTQVLQSLSWRSWRSAQ